MLTRPQTDCLNFIKSYIAEHGIAPSFSDIQVGIGARSKATVFGLIRALEERGFIRRLPRRARAMEVVRLPSAVPHYTRAALRRDIDEIISIAENDSLPADSACVRIAAIAKSAREALESGAVKR